LINKHKRNVICLIPARKGSVGLKRKNLRRIGCLTLIGRAIKVARQIQPPVFIILSTDDEKAIKRYSKKVNLSIFRKPELSSNHARITDVISDALKNLPNFGKDDLLVLLEPTSPNRTVEDLNRAINKMRKFNHDSLTFVSIVEAKFHPFKILKPNTKNELIAYSTSTPAISNRQEITKELYYRNGIAYVYRLESAKLLTSTVPKGTHYIVTKRMVANIDTNFDLWVARYLHFKGLFYKLARLKQHLNSR